ncbi:CU044_5270 family protein [Spirillospora sp. NPDC049652]
MKDQNDLKALDEAWPVPGPPSPAARAAARAALMDRAASASASASEAVAAVAPGKPARSARRGRRRWTFGQVAVGAAAAAAVAVAVAVPSSGAHREGGVRLVSANTVLDRAALAAGHRPFQAPRPDQWVMIENRGVVDELKLSRGRSHTLDLTRDWVRVDGTQYAFWDWSSRKLQTRRLPAGARVAGSYAEVSELPTDPDALIATIAARRKGRASPYKDLAGPAKARAGQVQVVGDLTNLLEETTPPPALQVAVYKALKKAPGGTVNPTAQDPLGRPAISVTWGGTFARYEILLDPSTYAYLGGRTITVKPLPRRRETGTVVLPAGTVLRAFVRTRAGIVDKPGQLPR